MKATKYCAALSLAAVSALISAATVHAAAGDIYDISNPNAVTLKYTQSQMASISKQHEVLNNAIKYGYALDNGKVYTIKALNDEIDALYKQGVADDKLIDATFNAIKNDPNVVTIPEPKTLAVSSVSAITKTSVDVKLAAAPAAVPTADRFVVKVGDAAVSVTKVTAKTGTTDTFTLDVALDGKEGTVSVNGVASAAFDYKAPSIAKITPVSSKIIDITYSEDVNAGLAQVVSNYTMAQTGTANVVNMTGASIDVKDSKTVRVTLASALTKDVEYTVTVKNMQDASKNTMDSDGSSSTFTAIEDTTKSTIASAVAKDIDTIEVTMSKEMQTAPTAKVQLIKADGTLDTAITNTATVKNNVVTVTLTDATKYMKTGSNYRVTLTGGADMSNNVVADNQTVDVAGVSDEIAPTVSGTPTYDAANKKLTINFSEAVENSGEADNYSIFETETGLPAGGTVTPTVSDDKKSVVLTLGTALNGSTSYSVRLKGYDASTRLTGLMDSSKSKNALVNNTVVKFTTDAVVTPVELSSATKPGTDDGKTVILAFNTNLVKTEAENIANYAIVKADDATKTLAVTKAVYDDSAKTVTLTTAAQEEGTNNYKVTVSNLTNLKADQNTATFSGKDKVAPVFTSAAALSSKIIDLTFDSEIEATPAASTVSIVEKGTANVITTAGATLTKQSNKNTARLTLADGVALTAGKTYVVTVTGIKDMNTNASEAQTSEFTFAAEDTQAPTLTNVVAKNGATIELCFNEEVAINTGLDNNNFVIKKGTETVAVNTLVATQDATDKTKITLVNKNAGVPATIFENGASYTITVKDNGANYIKDITGNKVTEAAYSFTGVVDATKPQLVSAKMGDSDNKVVLTFSEPIQTIIGNETAFTVTNANTGVQDVVTAVASGTGDDANKVTLTLASSTETGTQYRVYINNASTIKDNEVTPNTLDTTKASALFDGADLTAPSANVAAVLKDANTLILTFSEKLDSTSVSKSDFVIGDGSTIAVTNAVVGTGDAANTVTLTMSGNEDTGLAAPAIKIAAGQYVADLAGNKLGATNATPLTITSYADKATPSLVNATVATGSGMKIVGADGIYTATKLSDAAIGDVTLKFTEVIDPSTLSLAVYNSNGKVTLDDATLNAIKTILINENATPAKTFVKNVASSYSDVKTLMNGTAGTTVTKLVFTYTDANLNQSSFELNIN